MASILSKALSLIFGRARANEEETASDNVIEIPDGLTELEYDHVPTEWLNMPYLGPAILCRKNDMIVDFAESYDYNYFVGYKEDSDGIIWSEDICLRFENKKFTWLCWVLVTACRNFPVACGVLVP